MAQRPLIAKALLWLFIITFSLYMGAGLYEMRVVAPLWSAAPPGSIREWNSELRYKILPRERFWRFGTPALGLAAAGALISGWWIGTGRRKWLLGATIPVMLMIAATYLYFAPTLAEMLDAKNATLGDEEIIQRVNRWLWLSRLRAVVYVAAWLAGLRALCLSAGPD